MVQQNHLDFIINTHHSPR